MLLYRNDTVLKLKYRCCSQHANIGTLPPTNNVLWSVVIYDKAPISENTTLRSMTKVWASLSVCDSSLCSFCSARCLCILCISFFLSLSKKHNAAHAVARLVPLLFFATY